MLQLIDLVFIVQRFCVPFWVLLTVAGLGLDNQLDSISWLFVHILFSLQSASYSFRGRANSAWAFLPAAKKAKAKKQQQANLPKLPITYHVEEP